MIIYIGEAIGTFLFVFLSHAIIFNAVSDNHNNKISLIVTSIGVGLAYIVPCIIFGEITGGHFNPAITIATSLSNIFERRFMVGYIVSEAIGAIFASLLYSICNREKMVRNATVMSNYKMYLGYPNDSSYAVYFIKEIFATFILMFAMLAITFLYKDLSVESSYILFFFVIVAIGFAFDYTTITANPFRELFTKLFFAPRVIKQKINMAYVLFALLAPVIGAILACKLYTMLPWE